MTLIDIAKKYPRTDKESLHNYLGFYERMIGKFDSYESGNYLEIGVYAGDSLRLIRDRLPNFHVYGVDVDKRSMFSEERIKTFLVDATLEADIKLLENLKFDIVLDDGSHRLEDQLASFELLFPKLNLNGMYFIEDFVQYDLYQKILESCNTKDVSRVGVVDCCKGATDKFYNNSKIVFVER